jgi:hypothetical protein
MVTLDTQYRLALNETKDSNLLNILTTQDGFISNFLFIIKFSNSYF